MVIPSLEKDVGSPPPRVQLAFDLLDHVTTKGKPDEAEFASLVVSAWKRCYKTEGLAPILPIMFNLKGRPYSLKKHLPMAPMFRIWDVPREMLFKCGRQVAKSTGLAYQGLGSAIVTPYFNTLFVTPLYEQIRRFSSNYMRQAVRTCRLRDQITDRSYAENVLQRTLANDSSMFFSFAFTDCERTRGINSDAIKYDEVQGIDKDFIPVINESMSASEHRLVQYSGTPLTKDNTIERLWRNSSMAEWTIPCRNCKHENKAGYQFDIVKMIGKYGLICAKCGKAINTEEGYWTHLKPHKRRLFAGYHAPQIVFPMHCRDEVRWAELLRKMEKPGNETTFMNECLGESWDSGSKLVTLDDLQTACRLSHKNNYEAARKAYEPNKYVMRVLAIDWSGGGSKEESLTCMSILGLLPSGKIEVPLMVVKPHRINHAQDAYEAMKMFDDFFCHGLVHDYTGAGSNRENLLITLGFPMEKIIPISLNRMAGRKEMMTYTSPTKNNVRSSYILDKPRSLVYTCELIKHGYIDFPKYTSCEEEIEHFLALVEETVPTPRGGDLYLVGKEQGVPDDAAQAVNLGVHAIYTLQGKYPELMRFDKLTLKQSTSALAEAGVGLDSKIFAPGAQ